MHSATKLSHFVYFFWARRYHQRDHAGGQHRTDGGAVSDAIMALPQNPRAVIRPRLGEKI